MRDFRAKALVIDTNLLLHFKRPNELDWTPVGDEVVLVVLPVVLRELEKVKASSPVSKLRERAAGAIAWLGGLLDRGEEVQLKKGVRLRFHPFEPPLDFSSHNLVREVQDDHLIAGLLELSAAGGERAVLVTADIGLKVKAKQRGFLVVTPLDKDKLAEEPDAREKELAELRIENQQLKARVPRVVLCAAHGQPRVQIARPMAPSERKSLEAVMRSYPKLTTAGDDRSVFGSIAQSFADPTKRAQAEYNVAIASFYQEYRVHRVLLLQGGS
jgi:predicted ribonuclease YlaK